MSEYSHCSICGGSFIGIGNVCPGCEDALSREPLEIRPIERKYQEEFSRRGGQVSRCLAGFEFRPQGGE